VALGRRFLGTVPKLTRRPWEDIGQQLEDFLRKLWDAQSDGIPSGFNEVLPTDVVAPTGTGLGDPGTENQGWAAADHQHVAPTGMPIPVGVGLAEQEGTEPSLARSDHRHELVVWRRVGLTMDGGLAVVTTGVKGYVAAPFNGTIDSWELESDLVGSCVVDVWKARRTPRVTDSICGVDKPTLVSGTSATGLVTGWTDTSIEIGDVFGFYLDSVTDSTVLILRLNARET